MISTTAARRAIALALLAGLLASTASAAQSAPPFSRLKVAVAAAAKVNRSRLNDTWRSGNGGLLRLETPFHLGSVAADAQLIPFTSRSGSLPHFNTFAVTVEWNGELPLGRALRASAGLHAGSVNFVFIDPATGDSPFSENEFLSGAQVGIEARLLGGLGVALRAKRQKIFTHSPIYLTFATAGLEYSTTVPAWLRGFLE